MKKKLLFVNQSQYGYHIDYVQYCNYLKEDFDITFLCWDYKKKKIEESRIKIIYVSRSGNIIKRNIRFIQYTLRIIKKYNFALVFIHFFRGASLIPLLNRNNQKIHLDIRTGSISQNKVNRFIYNTILQFESHFFKSISIISPGLRNKLCINKNAYILPLGANPISVKRQFKHKLHLLYVGTLSNRRIEDTVEGIKLFLIDQPKADIYYTIVGEGYKNEQEDLQNRIFQLGLQNHIELKGYVPHYELVMFYQVSNLGLSYIPITPYYEYQPATKTYEYLMAGMPVIATKTYENKQIINQSNGVLIKDTPISFAKGISKIYNNIDSFNSEDIKKSAADYEWSKIIQTMKRTILS